jgi:hypothetical protein
MRWRRSDNPLLSSLRPQMCWTPSQAVSLLGRKLLKIFFIAPLSKRHLYSLGEMDELKEGTVVVVHWTYCKHVKDNEYKHCPLKVFFRESRINTPARVPPSSHHLPAESSSCSLSDPSENEFSCRAGDFLTGWKFTNRCIIMRQRVGFCADEFDGYPHLQHSCQERLNVAHLNWYSRVWTPHGMLLTNEDRISTPPWC